MQRREFLHATAITTLAGSALLRAAQPKAARPQKPMNILLLMTDQHRPDALSGCGDPLAKTPALDKLAAEGATMREAYCQFPLCVPSRSSILLGRYVHSINTWSNSASPIKGMVSLPQHLRKQGYKTACIGKLHVHRDTKTDWDLSWSAKEFSPAKKLAKDKKTMKFRTLDYPQLGLRLDKKYARYGAPSPYVEKGHMEFAVKDKTIEFLRKNKANPFFVQCSFLKPHAPFQPPKKYWDLYKDVKIPIPKAIEEDNADMHPYLQTRGESWGVSTPTNDEIRDAIRGYYGCVAFCDAMFKEVLDELERLGLAENTLVIYTSDHGEMLWDHGLWHKNCFFDQSVRVPLIMRLPGVVNKGVSSKALVELIDLCPTVLDLAGLQPLKGQQGKSLRALLAGKTKTHRDAVFSEVLYWGHGKMSMIYDGRHKLIAPIGKEGFEELYDRKVDPGEWTNAVAEADKADVLAVLRKKLDALNKLDVRTGNEGNPPKPDEKPTWKKKKKWKDKWKKKSEASKAEAEKE
ncbi:MAG: sulfatase-like hydrolase/transferase [Phycisphaerales bacterium]|jgi:choline-sulfatase|nr:sulfatase-like hydrolase/transferase [Phycisphaerales bacterium]MBT7171485.1 sulfatase-like hydrolase/transferase [Phycisphaerales bacterium]